MKSNRIISYILLIASLRKGVNNAWRKSLLITPGSKTVKELVVK